jgi:hypothetical protein
MSLPIRAVIPTEPVNSLDVICRLNTRQFSVGFHQKQNGSEKLLSHFKQHVTQNRTSEALTSVTYWTYRILHDLACAGTLRKALSAPFYTVSMPASIFSVYSFFFKNESEI